MSDDRADLPGDVESTLEVVRDNALRLLSAFPRPPSVLRIQAGGVTVEAEWPVTPAPPGAMAAETTGPPAGTSSAPRDDTAGGPPGEQDSLHYLRSPAVGVFFRAPEPAAKPFVEVGDTVLAGQQVAIIEVMKLMIPVQADADGRIVDVLKTNGAAVEYDEPLFAVAPLEP